MNSPERRLESVVPLRNDAHQEKLNGLQHRALNVAMQLRSILDAHTLRKDVSTQVGQDYTRASHELLQVLTSGISVSDTEYKALERLMQSADAQKACIDESRQLSSEQVSAFERAYRIVMHALITLLRDDDKVSLDGLRANIDTAAELLTMVQGKSADVVNLPPRS